MKKKKYSLNDSFYIYNYLSLVYTFKQSPMSMYKKVDIPAIESILTYSQNIFIRKLATYVTTI